MAKVLLYNDKKLARNRLIHLRRAYGARNNIKKHLTMLNVPFDVTVNPSGFRVLGGGVSYSQKFYYTNYILFEAQKRLLKAGYSKDDVVEMKTEAVVDLAGYKFPIKRFAENGVANLGKDADIMSLCSVTEDGFLQEIEGKSEDVLKSAEVYIEGSDAIKWQKIQAFARLHTELLYSLKKNKNHEPYIGRMELLPTLRQSRDSDELFMELDEFNKAKIHF